MFCAGGDVASELEHVGFAPIGRPSLSVGVVQNAADPATRPKAMDFFKRECACPLPFDPVLTF